MWCQFHILETIICTIYIMLFNWFATYCSLHIGALYIYFLFAYEVTYFLLSVYIFIFFLYVNLSTFFVYLSIFCMWSFFLSEYLSTFCVKLCTSWMWSCLFSLYVRWWGKTLCYIMHKLLMDFHRLDKHMNIVINIWALTPFEYAGQLRIIKNAP